MFFDTGLVATELVYTIAVSSVGVTDSTAAPITCVVLVTCACLFDATIASMYLRYSLAEWPQCEPADRSGVLSMFSGVYVHNVVIAFAAVLATSSLVCTNARSARNGCSVAPATAAAPTKRTPAAAAAMVSRLPAGRCGTRIGSSCGVSSAGASPVSALSVSVLAASGFSTTGVSSALGSDSVTVLAVAPALAAGNR